MLEHPQLSLILNAGNVQQINKNSMLKIGLRHKYRHCKKPYPIFNNNFIYITKEKSFPRMTKNSYIRSCMIANMGHFILKKSLLKYF